MIIHAVDGTIFRATSHIIVIVVGDGRQRERGRKELLPASSLITIWDMCGPI